MDHLWHQYFGSLLYDIIVYAVFVFSPYSQGSFSYISVVILTQAKYKKERLGLSRQTEAVIYTYL